MIVRLHDERTELVRVVMQPFLLAAVPDGFFRTLNKPPHKASPLPPALLSRAGTTGDFLCGGCRVRADPQAQPVAEGHGAGPIAQSGPHRFLERLQLWQDGLRGGADQRLHPALAEGQREQPIGAPILRMGEDQLPGEWEPTAVPDAGQMPILVPAAKGAAHRRVRVLHTADIGQQDLVGPSPPALLQSGTVS